MMMQPELQLGARLPPSLGLQQEGPILPTAGPTQIQFSSSSDECYGDVTTNLNQISASFGLTRLA